MAMNHATAIDDIRGLGAPLQSPADLGSLVERARHRRVVAIGEASHGTHEFYAWRAELTRRLIEEQDFTWIAVEGDWPDCWRIDRWVRGIESPESDATEMLRSFERWPTWMWANIDVANFLDWLRELNLSRSTHHRVGFYGMDVYSLWDSLHRVMEWLGANAPTSLPSAYTALRCFAPYGEDPQRYAFSTRLVPEGCEAEVVELLTRVREEARSASSADLDAIQNAEVAAGAEQYYRAMVRSDRGSWNIRDVHMADTIERLAMHHGSGSKGVVWAHNTHIGDARATSMAAHGMLNLGQLLRERYGEAHVLLVGMGTHRGTVIAAARWGAEDALLALPPARTASHEALLHDALGHDAVLDFSGRSRHWLATPAGHRAVGVVYEPEHESGNYVTTMMGRRYDAFLWIEQSTGLVPLRPEPVPTEAEYETEPTGF